MRKIGGLNIKKILAIIFIIVFFFDYIKLLFGIKKAKVEAKKSFASAKPTVCAVSQNLTSKEDLNLEGMKAEEYERAFDENIVDSKEFIDVK